MCTCSPILGGNVIWMCVYADFPGVTKEKKAHKKKANTATTSKDL